jgi:hypothetical protein
LKKNNAANATVGRQRKRQDLTAPVFPRQYVRPRCPYRCLRSAWLVSESGLSEQATSSRSHFRFVATFPRNEHSPRSPAFDGNDKSAPEASGIEISCLTRICPAPAASSGHLAATPEGGPRSRPHYSSPATARAPGRVP